MNMGETQEQLLGRLDAKYGPEHRTDAISRTQQRLRDRGFSPQDPPRREETLEVLEEEYRAASTDDLVEGRHLTLNEAAAQMEREGRL